MTKYAALRVGIDSDGKATADVAEVAKTAKWRNHPITLPEHTEHFFDYLLQVMKAGGDLETLSPVIDAMKVADADSSREAAIAAVGLRYCDDMIKYAVENDKELPSAAYIQTRLPLKSGEKSVTRKAENKKTQSSCVPQNETDADTTIHVDTQNTQVQSLYGLA